MSEADRVFPRHEEQGTKTSSGERRIIFSASRKRGAGSSSSRVVEVVHARLGMPGRTADHSHVAQGNVRAETWTGGFRARAASTLPRQDLKPNEASVAQPTLHVLPAWEPSSKQPAQQPQRSAETAAETSTVERHKPRPPEPRAPRLTARHFADPYAVSDDRANCFRCGYLVEPAREKRGLMTCSTCE
jgi:hypothetical protein